MKKVLLIAIGAAMLAGCTPREQQLLAAGAVGAVAGAVIANEASQPRQHVYIEERRYAPPPRYIPQRQCFKTWERSPYGMVERVQCR